MGMLNGLAQQRLWKQVPLMQGERRVVASGATYFGGTEPYQGVAYLSSWRLMFRPFKSGTERGAQDFELFLPLILGVQPVEDAVVKPCFCVTVRVGGEDGLASMRFTPQTSQRAMALSLRDFYIQLVAALEHLRQAIPMHDQETHDEWAKRSVDAMLASGSPESGVNSPASDS